MSTAAYGGEACGLTLMPSQSQTADVLTDASVAGIVAGHLATASDGHALSQMQHSVGAVSDVGPNLRTLAHLPTILIDYWFRSICPMRSTFDSDVNYNRQLAQSMWSTSEAVYYSMQAMSAACLLDCVPQLTKDLPMLKAQATASIWRSLSLVRMSAQPRVSVDLIFAVFSMGTSIHWTALTVQDYPWLESARELLSLWQARLDASDVLVHGYFTQALTYWEMLIATGGQGSIADSVDTKRRQVQWPLDDWIHVTNNPASYDTHQDLLGTRPNSWCGISNEVIHVFGQVLALCRSVVHLEQNSRPASDVLIALGLQRDLLAMDFDALVFMDEAQGFAVETRDINTPISHLLWTAEAFRQAALLQLDFTFEDLGRAPQEPYNGTVGDARTDEEGRGELLLISTLGLIKVLERIPPESGSRSIHPMLLLSAAAGLRFSTGADFQDSAHVTGNLEEGDDPFRSLLSEHLAVPMASSLSNTVALELDLPNGGSQSATGSTNVSPTSSLQSTLEVTRARQFVWTRLQNLQRSLPHGASHSMLHLVKSIWRAYDEWQPGDSDVHWLNVWKECGLGSTLW